MQCLFFAKGLKEERILSKRSPYYRCSHPGTEGVSMCWDPFHTTFSREGTTRNSFNNKLMEGVDWWSFKAAVLIPQSRIGQADTFYFVSSNWFYDHDQRTIDYAMCTVDLTNCGPRPANEVDVCFCSGTHAPDAQSLVLHDFIVRKKLVEKYWSHSKVYCFLCMNLDCSTHEYMGSCSWMWTIVDRTHMIIHQDGLVLHSNDALIQSDDFIYAGCEYCWPLYSRQDLFVIKDKPSVLKFCFLEDVELTAEYEGQNETKTLTDLEGNPPGNDGKKCWIFSKTFELSNPVYPIKLSVKYNDTTTSYNVSVKGHPCSIADPCNSHQCSPRLIGSPVASCKCLYDRDGQMTTDIARWNIGDSCQEPHPCAMGHVAACGPGAICFRNPANDSDKMCFTFSGTVYANGGGALQGSILTMVVLAAGGVPRRLHTRKKSIII